MTKVTNKDLKSFLSASRSKTTVVGPIEKFMATKVLDNSRAQDVLHPSEIVKDDWCHRESYYKILQAREGILSDPERPSLRLQSIFDVGHAVHAKWQGYLAEMGKLYGRWQCGSCGWTTDYLAESREANSLVCLQCAAVSWKYAELGLRDDDLLISGSTDGWLVGLGDDALLEIKSVGTGTIRAFDVPLLIEHDNNLEKAFENIRRPFRDHRRQGQLYLHLAHLMDDKGLLDRPAPESIIFLYECKANQSYKEFRVSYDPEQIEDVIDAAKDIAWALKHQRPPRCNHDATKGCKKCARYAKEN